jgi:hypothetical protein
MKVWYIICNMMTSQTLSPSLVATSSFHSIAATLSPHLEVTITLYHSISKITKPNTYCLVTILQVACSPILTVTILSDH